MSEQEYYKHKADELREKDAKLIRLEAENAELKKTKANWESLKDLLYLTIDNYGDDEDIDTSVAEQVLDEMNKLEAQFMLKCNNRIEDQ